MPNNLDVWRCSCGKIVMIKPDEYLHTGTPCCADCNKEMAYTCGTEKMARIARHIANGWSPTELVDFAVNHLIRGYEECPGFFEIDKKQYDKDKAEG